MNYVHICMVFDDSRRLEREGAIYYKRRKCHVNKSYINRSCISMGCFRL